MTLGTNFDTTKATIQNIVGDYGELYSQDFQTVTYRDGDKLIYFEFDYSDYTLQGIFVDGIYGLDDGAFYITEDGSKTMTQMLEQAKRIEIIL